LKVVFSNSQQLAVEKSWRISFKMKTIIQVGDLVKISDVNNRLYGVTGYVKSVHGSEVVVRIGTKDMTFLIGELLVETKFAEKVKR
jgi:hypothetical protein